MRKADGERIVVWANAVAEARYALSVPEQRLVLWLAAQIEREDDALQERTISILEMQEIIGGNNHRIYEQFEDVCDRLMARVLELRDDEKQERVKFNWMHRVMYKDGLGCITLRFHDELKPLLLNLKARFSMVPLKTVFKLRGGYAIRWYEMLVAKKHIGLFNMYVEDLRDWLAVDDGELPNVEDLRRRAIDVPKAELSNKADLTFVYAPIKLGRRIVGWKFKVMENHPRPVQRQLPLKGEGAVELPETARQAQAAQSDSRLETVKTRWNEASLRQRLDWLDRMDPVSKDLAPVNGSEPRKGFLMCLSVVLEPELPLT